MIQNVEEDERLGSGYNRVQKGAREEGQVLKNRPVVVVVDERYTYCYITLIIVLYLV